MSGYIYLIYTPEYIDADIPVYKLGRTMQEIFERFKAYPKGSKLLLHREVNDHIRIERELIVKFNELFTLVDGREWFLGDRYLMEDTINEHIRLTRTRSVEAPRVKTEKKEPPKSVTPRATEPPKTGYSWGKYDKRMEDTLDSLTARFGGISVNDDDYVRRD